MNQVSAAAIVESPHVVPACLVLPPVLSHNSFEYFLHQFDCIGDIYGCEVEFDARTLTAISSYAVLLLIILVQFLESKQCRIRIDFENNQNIVDVLTGWNFFNQCPSVDCDVSGNISIRGEDIFLPAIKITDSRDVYAVIAFLREHLRLPIEQISYIAIAISEITQNILEHSCCKGFISIAKNFNLNAGKPMLSINVVDAGIGISESLKEKIIVDDENSRDAVALYKTLYEGLSRHHDLGRGNGIIKTRELVTRHGGKMMIRSGTAKLWGNIPVWELQRFMRKQLCFLPGTQINFTLPA